MWAWIALLVAFGAVVFGVVVAYHVGAHNAVAVRNLPPIDGGRPALRAEVQRAEQPPAAAVVNTADTERALGQALLAEVARRMVSGPEAGRVVDLGQARAHRQNEIRD
jgi:hypothetical protein